MTSTMATTANRNWSAARPLTCPLRSSGSTSTVRLQARNATAVPTLATASIAYQGSRRDPAAAMPVPPVSPGPVAEVAVVRVSGWSVRTVPVCSGGATTSCRGLGTTELSWVVIPAPSTQRYGFLTDCYGWLETVSQSVASAVEVKAARPTEAGCVSSQGARVTGAGHRARRLGFSVWRPPDRPQLVPRVVPAVLTLR